MVEHETRCNHKADIPNHSFDRSKSHESYDLVPNSAYYMKNPECGLIIARLSKDLVCERNCPRHSGMSDNINLSFYLIRFCLVKLGQKFNEFGR